MRPGLAALALLLTACTPKAAEMPHGAAIAPPRGFVDLCRRQPSEPNCRFLSHN